MILLLRMEPLPFKDLKYLDSVGGIARLGDKGTYIELAETFDKDSLQPAMTEIMKAFPKNDFVTVRAQSHALKGICSYLGAERAVLVCERMHKLIDEKKIAEIGQLYAVMIYELTLLKKELRRYLCKEKGKAFAESEPSDKKIPEDPKYAYALNGLKK